MLEISAFFFNTSCICPHWLKVKVSVRSHSESDFLQRPASDTCQLYGGSRIIRRSAATRLADTVSSTRLTLLEHCSVSHLARSARALPHFGMPQILICLDSFSSHISLFTCFRVCHSYSFSYPIQTTDFSVTLSTCNCNGPRVGSEAL